MTATNQIASQPSNWMHCPGNSFMYSGFSPFQPCVPLSLDDNKFQSLILSFENPVRNKIRLTDIVVGQLHSAKIIDISGKIIREYLLDLSTIDASFLPKGLYLLQLTNFDGELVVKKFAKD